MDTAVFYEVVVPLLELDNTALICISTILDSFNFYSKLHVVFSGWVLIKSRAH